MSGENIYVILVAAAIIIPIWQIFTAYNKRVNEIEELREEVEKLKQRDENAGSSVFSNNDPENEL